MNKTGLIVLTIVGCSILMYLIMYFLLGFKQEKALIIAGGAGMAMIIFDVIIGKGRKI